MLWSLSRHLYDIEKGISILTCTVCNTFYIWTNTLLPCPDQREDKTQSRRTTTLLIMRPVFSSKELVGNILSRLMVMNLHSVQSACAGINTEVVSTPFIKVFIYSCPTRCTFTEENRKPLFLPCSFTVECDEKSYCWGYACNPILNAVRKMNSNWLVEPILKLRTSPKDFPVDTVTHRWSLQLGFKYAPSESYISMFEAKALDWAAFSL